MDINYKGEFTSIEAVWERYPEGGIEGDYLYINSVKYRWNKYDCIWENAETVTDSPARRIDNFDGDVHVQNDLVVGGTLRAKKVKQPNCGLFATEAALNAAFPKPEVGMWAAVGDTLPADIYRCNTEGVWEATGEVGPTDTREYGNVLSYKSAESTGELPSSPTADEKRTGYLIGSKLYVWVGTGGDVLDGKYKDCGEFKGPQGNSGVASSDGIESWTNLDDPEDIPEDTEQLVNVAGAKAAALMFANRKIADISLSADGKKITIQKTDGTEVEFEGGGDIESEDSILPDVDVFFMMSVVNTLIDVTNSNAATEVRSGLPYSATLSPKSGYRISNASVTMGGVDITDTVYNNGVITISEVTGNIEIYALAAEIGKEPIVFADPEVESIVLANFPHEDPNFITEQEAAVVTSLGGKFKNNTAITSFDELNKFGVTQLASDEFYGCSSLVSINLQNIESFTYDSRFGGCFRNCSSLAKAKISDAVTLLPLNLFNGCSALSLVDVGSGVTTIGATVLLSTPNPKTIVMRMSTPPTYEYTWKSRGGTLYVPDAAFDTWQETSWGVNYPSTPDQYGTCMKRLSEYVEQ